jgi:serine/threonine protein kinase
MDQVVPSGPVMGAHICEWLDRGGPFPATITLVSSTIRYELEVLDRSEDGVVTSLFNGRRRGKKGFVLKVRDRDTRYEMAAKFCIPAEYADGSLETELAYAKELGNQPMFVLPRAVGDVQAFESQPDRERWVCILSDWLPGKTLGEVVSEAPAAVTPALIAVVASVMVQALLVLESKGLKHDDLHLGNIMLVPNPMAQIDADEPDHHLKIIDLGSVKRKNTLTSKLDDDWSSFAKCLAELFNCIQRNRAVASRYPRFLRGLSEYIHDLADEDAGRYFPAPQDYIRRVKDIRDSISDLPTGRQRFTPFEAISAEHLANDQVLLDLFVSHLPWIDMVQKPEPQVLSGPRGCGKSMVFRYLAARTHFVKPADAWAAIERLGFFGVYIGCGSDLGADLAWLARVKGRVAERADDVVTYFCLVVARELFRSLALASRDQRVAAELQITPGLGAALSEHLRELSDSRLEIMRLAGMNPYQACADALERMRLSMASALLRSREAPILLPQTFLRDLCRRLAAEASRFQTIRITFLLDDYTAQRLSSDIQQVLNAVLWIRDSSHSFKVSSEPYGFQATHIDGAKIDENREYVPIDVGRMSLDSKANSARRDFITKLLDKRLEAAKYVGRVETLIGPSESKTDPELANVIRSTKGDRQGARYYYNGIHVLADAWSGDVATILHMVRDMFARAGIGPTSNERIGKGDQHKSIVAVSGALRDRVDGFHPHGQQMSRILRSFGDLARKLLVEAPKDASSPEALHRRYRIELSLETGADLDREIKSQFPDVGEELVTLRRELVRRAIFIELPSSRAKESAERRTFRWQLRSSLLPSFGTSLVRESYIDIKKISDFVELLSEPEDACAKIYRRYAATPPHRDLFTETEA